MAITEDVGAPPEAAELRPLDVDWRALEWAVDHGAPDEPAFLDTRTGEVGYLPASDACRETSLAPLDSLTAAEEIEWMQSFVEDLPDDWPRDALVEALLHAPAPRRAFEQALGRFPAERVRWLACRRELVRSRLVAWLARLGLAAAV